MRSKTRQVLGCVVIVASLAVSGLAKEASGGAGRGFGVGQTVPDIPLVDLQGKEVRFSEFLGKRYIIYCWASW